MSTKTHNNYKLLDIKTAARFRKLPRIGIQYQLKPTPIGWKSID